MDTVAHLVLNLPGVQSKRAKYVIDIGVVGIMIGESLIYGSPEAKASRGGYLNGADIPHIFFPTQTLSLSPIC